MSPNKPPGMRPKGVPRATEGDGEVYDSVSELSGEEWSGEEVLGSESG